MAVEEGAGFGLFASLPQFLADSAKLAGIRLRAAVARPVVELAGQFLGLGEAREQKIGSCPVAWCS